MSLAWYIVTKEEIEGVDATVDGKALAHCDEEVLEKIFEELEVANLTDFLSISPEEIEDL